MTKYRVALYGIVADCLKTALERPPMSSVLERLRNWDPLHDRNNEQ